MFDDMKKTVLSLIACFAAMATPAQQLERVKFEEAGIDSASFCRVDDVINDAIAEGTMPGAVLAVVRYNNLVYLKAYGDKRVYPNREPMTVNTVFDLASCSKAVSTATCIHLLCQRGKLRLMDSVDRFLPEFKNWSSDDGKQKKTIRIMHLLTHTSGLPAYVSPSTLQKLSPEGVDEKTLCNYIDTCRREFCPQTDMQYSCLNFITLQRIIEKVSGKSLREFAHDNIFAPLGMKFTDYLPCAQDKKGYWRNTSTPPWASLVKGDWHDIIAPTELQPNGQVLCGQVHDPLARVCNHGISGNAGLFSTAEDLSVLCNNLLYDITSNKFFMGMLTKTSLYTIPKGFEQFGRTPGWDKSSAYASVKGDYLSDMTICHSGYTGTSIVLDPQTNLAIILLSNAVHPKDGHSMVRVRSLVANVIASSLTDFLPY